MEEVYRSGVLPRPVGIELGIGAVASREADMLDESIAAMDESLSDVLKAATLASLIAVPGIVDGKAVERKLGVGAGGKNPIVRVSDPKVQKKVYDAIGKDKYLDAVIANLISRTLMAEAIGEKTTRAFDAVASVIWNRAGGNKRRMADVILSPRQFSCWNKLTDDEKRNFVIKPHGRSMTNPSAWAYCQSLAKSMVDGTFSPIGSWTHYYAKGRANPNWASQLVEPETIGRHVFGTL